MQKFIPNKNYLLVELSGNYSLKFFMDSIHKIFEQSKKEKNKRILVDLRKIDGNPSILDRYEIGLEISKLWGKNIQVAAVAKQEVINDLIENVAMNRGANLQVFTKMESALEWLGITNNE